MMNEKGLEEIKTRARDDNQTYFHSTRQYMTAKRDIKSLLSFIDETQEELDLARAEWHLWTRKALKAIGLADDFCERAKLWREEAKKADAVITELEDEWDAERMRYQDQLVLTERSEAEVEKWKPEAKRARNAHKKTVADFIDMRNRSEKAEKQVTDLLKGNEMLAERVVELEKELAEFKEKTYLVHISGDCQCNYCYVNKALEETRNEIAT